MSVLIYEKKDHLVHIILNRPEAMNSFNEELRRVMLGAWYRFRDDDDAWVAIVSGSGSRAFSTGADLKHLASLPVDSPSSQWSSGPPSLAVRGIPLWKPVVAAISGYCLAGGLELAMTCDIRVATEQSQFGLAEVTRGIIPGGGGTQRLARLIGLGKAMELLLTGVRVGAPDAHRLGLINRVVPEGQHVSSAEEIAQVILGNGPLAARAIKEAVIRGMSVTLEEGFRVESLLAMLIAGTEDAKEGARAFSEKRAPVFYGR